MALVNKSVVTITTASLSTLRACISCVPRVLAALSMVFACQWVVAQETTVEASAMDTKVESNYAEPALLDVARPLRDAWQAARDEDKSVMLVLGADWCDRCALLERYMGDGDLNQRIDKRFVVLNLNVGNPDSFIQMENNSVQLPVIVMLDSEVEFNQLMASDNLLTFLPDPNQPIYEWLENLLIYTEQPLATL